MYVTISDDGVRLDIERPISFEVPITTIRCHSNTYITRNDEHLGFKCRFCLIRTGIIGILKFSFAI